MLATDTAFRAGLGRNTTGAVEARWVTQPGANGLAVRLWTLAPVCESIVSDPPPAVVGRIVWPGGVSTTLVRLTTAESPFTKPELTGPDGAVYAGGAGASSVAMAASCSSDMCDSGAETGFPDRCLCCSNS